MATTNEFPGIENVNIKYHDFLRSVHTMIHMAWDTLQQVSEETWPTQILSFQKQCWQKITRLIFKKKTTEKKYETHKATKYTTNFKIQNYHPENGGLILSWTQVKI